MKRKVTRFAKVEKGQNKKIMNEYRVYVREISSGVVYVQSENVEQAEEKAIDAVMQGEANWGNLETVVDDVKLVERVLAQPEEEE
jgi:hypothetical protein